jgi:hypothetical protein
MWDFGGKARRKETTRLGWKDSINVDLKERWNGVVWIGFIWLRIWTSGRLL